jgi:hypothetical protein
MSTITSDTTHIIVSTKNETAVQTAPLLQAAVEQFCTRAPVKDAARPPQDCKPAAEPQCASVRGSGVSTPEQPSSAVQQHQGQRADDAGYATAYEATAGSHSQNHDRHAANQAARQVRGMHVVKASWISQSVVHHASESEGAHSDAAGIAKINAVLDRLATGSNNLDASRSTHPADESNASKSTPDRDPASTLDMSMPAPDRQGADDPRDHSYEPWQKEALPGWGLSTWQPPGWTAAQWGDDEVWLEPYTESEVISTLQQLYQHKHRLDLAGEASPEKLAQPLSASPKAARTLIQDDDAVATGAKDAGEPGAGRTCQHVACRHAPVCIIEGLVENTHQYVKGRGADRFRLFGTQRAISTLQTVDKPLVTEQDVDELGLGACSQRALVFDYRGRALAVVHNTAGSL